MFPLKVMRSYLSAIFLVGDNLHPSGVFLFFIFFLLLCSKSPQTQWLKTTQICYSFHGSWVLGIRRVHCSGWNQWVNQGCDLIWGSGPSSKFADRLAEFSSWWLWDWGLSFERLPAFANRRVTDISSSFRTLTWLGQAHAGSNFLLIKSESTD